jgi:hypothetical protein
VPTDIVAFLDISDKDEILRIKRDAYQLIQFAICFLTFFINYAKKSVLDFLADM